MCFEKQVKLRKSEKSKRANLCTLAIFIQPTSNILNQITIDLMLFNWAAFKLQFSELLLLRIWT